MVLRMRNSYKGVCYRCRQIVNPGEGHFERIPPEERIQLQIKAKWRTQHATCAIRYRGTTVGKVVKRRIF